MNIEQNKQIVGDIKHSDAQNVNMVNSYNAANKIYGKQWIGIVADFLSLIGVVLSIIALASIKPTVGDLNFDYYGAVIGVLSLLLCFIIGWNIWSALSIKKEVEVLRAEFYEIKTKQIEKIIELERTFDEKIIETNDIVRIVDERSRRRLLYNLAKLEEELVLSLYSDVERFYYIISHSITAIGMWSELHEYKRANAVISFLLELVPEKLNVRKKDKMRWIESLKNVQNQNKIQRINELIVFISHFEEK